MKSTYTPGPWRIRHDSGDRHGYFREFWRSVSVEMSGSELRIGYGVEKRRWNSPDDIAYAFPKEEFEQAEANARLIASAPEMLETLKSVEMRLRHLDDAQSMGLWAVVKDAISKAEGRES